MAPKSVISRFDDYELIRPLGAGGMAQTFVAIRRGPGGFEQKVCVKRILPELAEDAALVEQFLDEASLLAHLRHANIVQVYDFGQTDGAYFMVLELIDGCDLDALMRFLRSEEREFPAAVAVHLIGQLLNALHHAHNAKRDGEPLHLVHRDISPSNILLSRQGEVKLADFGIAKSRHRKHKTQAGYTKGKISYMSPEQVRGDELDARSDLFAVGVMLHELLTGLHPFDAPTDMAVLSNILTGNRPALATLSPDLRSDLVVLIETLLETDRARRPASAEEALQLLPSLAQPFDIERQIADLVVACAARRESLTRTAPALHSPNHGATFELPVPARLRPSTGQRTSPNRSRENVVSDTADARSPEFVERRARPLLRKIVPLSAALMLGVGGAALYARTSRRTAQVSAVGSAEALMDASAEGAARSHALPPANEVGPGMHDPADAGIPRTVDHAKDERVPGARPSAPISGSNLQPEQGDAGATKKSVRSKRRATPISKNEDAPDATSEPEKPARAHSDESTPSEPSRSAARKHRSGISVTVDEF